MYGCEWDDETKELGGYYQYGYDGEDFISLDLPTTHWTAAKQQAVITKQKWDTNGFAISEKNYVSTICPDWLKKYVSYGSSSLMRTGKKSHDQISVIGKKSPFYTYNVMAMSILLSFSFQVVHFSDFTSSLCSCLLNSHV